MKTLLLNTALAAGLALPAFAQTQAQTPFQTEVVPQAVTASDLIGARIYASEAALDAESFDGVQDGWSDVGEVNDVIIGRDGMVDAVLIDIGGFLGIGEHKVAVDMSALHFVQNSATEPDDWFLVMQADRTMLDGAPVWKGLAEQAAATGAAVGNAASQAASDVAAAADQAAEDIAAASTDPAATGSAATPTGAGTSIVLPEGLAAVPTETLTTEMLIGAAVYNPDDGAIAEVADLVVAPDGKISDMVMDVGGFLGMGEHRVAIPLDRVTVAQAEGGEVRVVVNMTKYELKALPAYQG